MEKKELSSLLTLLKNNLDQVAKLVPIQSELKEMASKSSGASKERLRQLGEDIYNIADAIADNHLKIIDELPDLQKN